MIENEFIKYIEKLGVICDDDKLNKLKKYYEMGYYISAEVYGATPNNQHWIAIDWA